jgi:GDP-4-dehydro-6-deoxy-D-mannose reductase
MRVLITGVGGFAGRHLLDLCAARGLAVVGVGRTSTPPEGADGRLAEYLSADLSDARAAEAAVERAAADRVFHLAAEASVANSWRDPVGTLSRNLAGTQNVLEGVRAATPAARVLVACSGEEYGAVDAARLPVTEEEPLRPRNPYAAGKAAADVVAGFYADAFDLHVVRTRAFNHAGPGQSDTYVISSFARQIAAAEIGSDGPGVRLETGNTRVRRDFTDVRDVVRAYWLALDSGKAGEVYNVCRGKSTSVGELIAALGRHTDLEVEQRVDERRMRPGEVMEIAGSHERLFHLTGWRPEIPLDDTVGASLDWWRGRLGERSSQ